MALTTVKITRKILRTLIWSRNTTTIITEDPPDVYEMVCISVGMIDFTIGWNTAKVDAGVCFAQGLHRAQG